MPEKRLLPRRFPATPGASVLRKALFIRKKYRHPFQDTYSIRPVIRNVKCLYFIIRDTVYVFPCKADKRTCHRRHGLILFPGQHRMALQFGEQRDIPHAVVLTVQLQVQENPHFPLPKSRQIIRQIPAGDNLKPVGVFSKPMDDFLF